MSRLQAVRPASSAKPDPGTDVPNIKQQEKRMRLAAKQRLRNRQYKSSIKTLFKRFQTSVDEQDRDGATRLFTELTAKIDKAASKGVIHKNNAARKKSRVARVYARLS
jgi:small subunit ribosomal protein S20